MNKLPEPDDVDFFVGGVEPNSQAAIETMRAIEAYKRRPGYRFEVEEAEQVLTALGIDFRRYGMRDAQSLLDHWHRCVADLSDADQGVTRGDNGAPASDVRGNAGSSFTVEPELG